MDRKISARDLAIGMTVYDPVTEVVFSVTDVVETKYPSQLYVTGLELELVNDNGWRYPRIRSVHETYNTEDKDLYVLNGS